MAIVVYSWEADQEKSKHFVDCELALQNFNMSANKKVDDVSNLSINNSNQNDNTPVGDVISQTDLNDDASPNLGKSWINTWCVFTFIFAECIRLNIRFIYFERNKMTKMGTILYLLICFFIGKHSYNTYEYDVDWLWVLDHVFV